MSFKDQQEVTHSQSSSKDLRDTVRAVNQAGLALLAQKKPQAALEKFSDVLKNDPDHLFISRDALSYQCAQAHATLKAYETALECINQAVRDLPREAMYLAFKATVLDAQVRAMKQPSSESTGRAAFMAIFCYDAALFYGQPEPPKGVVKNRQALIQWTDKQLKTAKSSAAHYRLGHLNPTGHVLNLHDYMLDLQSTATLCEALASEKYTPLTTLYLDYTPLTEGQLASVATALSDNHSLTAIVWQGFLPGKKNAKTAQKQKIDALLHRNQLHQKKRLAAGDLRQLDFATLKPEDVQTVLRQHAATLPALDFEGLAYLNLQASIVDVITAPAKYPQLTALTLRRTQLGDKHVQQLYTGLTESSTVLFSALVTLDVRDNRIADVGFCLLLGLIKVLPRLQQLLLQDNHITRDLSSDFEAAKTMPKKDETPVSLYLSGNFLKPMTRTLATPDLPPQSHTPQKKQKEEKEEKGNRVFCKEIELVPLDRATPSASDRLLTEKERRTTSSSTEKKYKPEPAEETSDDREDSAEDSVLSLSREVSKSDDSTTSVSESKTMTASFLLAGLDDLSPEEQLVKFVAYQAYSRKQSPSSSKSSVSVYASRYPSPEEITAPASAPKSTVFEFGPDDAPFTTPKPRDTKTPEKETTLSRDEKTRTDRDMPPVAIPEEKLPSPTPVYTLINKAKRSKIGQFTPSPVRFFSFKSSASPRTSIIDPRKEITPTNWVVRLARTKGWQQSAFVLFEGMDERGQRFLWRAFLGAAENGRAPVRLEKNPEKMLSGLTDYYLSERYAYVITRLLVENLLDQLNTQVQEGIPYAWCGGCAPCGEETPAEKSKRSLNCMLWCRSLLNTLNASPLPSSLARAPCCAMSPRCG